MMPLEQKIFKKFTQRGQTLSLAESCTGGLIAHSLTNRPGSSQYFLLGIIAYDNRTKTKILKVPASILKKHGAVSFQTASLMAQGVRQILKTSHGLSITGIAGPGGGTPQKPVGLVFISLSTQNKTIVKRHLFKGSRLAIKKEACKTALKMLAK
ncbi:MAG: CinA family protein [Candidatus Omnitrophica bacterium]|nr:CinA family protein [Candidatus Omnitrophota bacterium]